MIFDKIENLDCYNSMIPCIGQIKSFLEQAGDSPVGRYDIDGGYVLVQEGETRSKDGGALFEAHRKYVDLQLVCEGGELVEWADVKDLREKIAYDEKKDAAFYEGEGISLPIAKGYFYLVLPHDAHKPCCHLDKPGSYRKIVFKIPCPQ